MPRSSKIAGAGYLVLQMLRLHFAFILLCLCLPGTLCAQLDSILALPPADRIIAFHDLHEALSKKDPAASKTLLEEAALVFADRSEADMQRLIHYLSTINQLYINAVRPRSDVMKDAIQLAKKKKWHGLTAELEFLEASIALDERQDIPAIEVMMDKLTTIEKLGWSSPFTQSNFNSAMGHTCYNYGDYELAISYLLKSMQASIPKTSLGYDFGRMNLLGLAYEKLQRYDSAIYYFQLALDIAEDRKEEAWTGIIMGNIGNAYYKKGDYQNALPYLEVDFEKSVANNIVGSAVNVSSILANIELDRGNINKAEAYLDYARTHKDTAILGVMILYMNNLFTYSKLKKDYASAVRYADSLQYYKARQDHIFNKEMLDKAGMRVQIARYNRDVQLLHAQKKRQILLRNGLLIIFLLTGIVALLLVKRIEFIRRTHKEKLAKAEADLNWFTKSLIEKNELIQSFREQQEQSRMIPPDLAHDKSISIADLTHASILTDDDWKRFRILFDDVYPGFLVRLKEKFNDLTPSELRLLALTKLRIEPKDMADMLGISPDSIKKTRYRLRKKINLPEEGTLEELVSLI